jgi:hypothetical protein
VQERGGGEASMQGSGAHQARYVATVPQTQRNTLTHHNTPSTSTTSSRLAQD